MVTQLCWRAAWLSLECLTLTFLALQIITAWDEEDFRQTVCYEYKPVLVRVTLGCTTRKGYTGVHLHLGISQLIPFVDVLFTTRTAVQCCEFSPLLVLKKVTEFWKGSSLSKELPVLKSRKYCGRNQVLPLERYWYQIPGLTHLRAPAGLGTVQREDQSIFSH